MAEGLDKRGRGRSGEKWSVSGYIFGDRANSICL